MKKILLLGGVGLVLFANANDKDVIKLITYKPNYILPLGYDLYSHDDKSKGFNYDRKKLETKFQISFKVPLAYNIESLKNANLYVAYTQTAFFQNYNQENSAPFRDINHNPEAFLEWNTAYYLPWLFNSRLTKVRFSISHKSNGQELPKSRSYNYNELDLEFTKNTNISFGLDCWYRWPEEDRDRNDPRRDDNPDLIDYIGQTRIWIKYETNGYISKIKYQNDITELDMSRGNFVFDFIAPMSYSKKMKWMFEYFYGYGESLIDYNDKVNKFYLGVSFSY